MGVLFVCLFCLPCGCCYSHFAAAARLCVFKFFFVPNYAMELPAGLVVAVLLMSHYDKSKCVRVCECAIH